MDTYSVAPMLLSHMKALQDTKLRVEAKVTML
jgi:hypothetical protein